MINLIEVIFITHTSRTEQTHSWSSQLRIVLLSKSSFLHLNIIDDMPMSCYGIFYWGNWMKDDTVYTLFLDMIKYELNFGAYWIYLALQRGYLQKYYPAWRVSPVQFTDEEIAHIYELGRRYVLGLNGVKLFATKLPGTQHLRTFYELKIEVLSFPVLWGSLSFKVTSLLYRKRIPPYIEGTTEIYSISYFIHQILHIDD